MGGRIGLRPGAILAPLKKRNRDPAAAFSAACQCSISVSVVEMPAPMSTNAKTARRPFGMRRLSSGLYGRSERIRTFDPLVPNEVRYQAALHSDSSTRRIERGRSIATPCPARKRLRRDFLGSLRFTRRLNAFPGQGSFHETDIPAQI